ncbi:MAG: MFS transporter [Deltaproteobacteria bacterium]|jgi:MFS family permease|nr:MFS transporter [Deltaproteobacteria bacterium]
MREAYSSGMRNIPTSLRAVLFAVCASQFMLPFMLAGVNAVLPILGEDLDLSARQMSFINTIYTLSLAIAQLSSGRIGDILGRRRLFLAGLGIFCLCSAALGFVRHFEIFVCIRFVQGLGAALFNASGLAILMTLAPAHRRSTVLGISAAAVYAGISCGPALAGLLAGAFGWRWLFWSTSLAAVAAWLLMCRNLQEEWRPGQGEPFDWPGFFCYSGFMLCLTLGASSLQHAFWAPWVLAGALCLLVCYIRLEWHSAFPLLELRLFTQNRVFSLSALAAFVNYASSFGISLYFSMYLQGLRGLSVSDAGMFLAVQAVVQMLVAPLSGRLADRYGPGPISTLGIALCGAGVALAALIAPDTPLSLLIGVQIFLGAGFGLFATPNTTLILESAGIRYLGQASGVTGAVRTGGMLANMIIVTTTLGFFMGQAPLRPENAPAFMESMRLDFCIFAGLNLLAVGCSLWRRRR